MVVKFSVYLSRHVFVMFANSVALDESAYNQPSHLDLHCFHSVLDLQLSPF